MNLSDFDYCLPPELIAQYPTEERDNARLLVVDKQRESIIHSQFKDIPEFLTRGDLLILNDTKVIPARLIGKKVKTGGVVELLLLERMDEKTWNCMVKGGKKLGMGSEVLFNEGQLLARVVEKVVEGRGLVEFDYSGEFFEVLQRSGVIPLPPYIKREPGRRYNDAERYQTVFARHPGSSAAPTAGLHFTDEVLDELKENGVNCAHVTLHVGPGTFIPVRTERIEDHTMEPEVFEIPSETIEAIEETVRGKSRVIGVGSTSLRCVESSYENGKPGGIKRGHSSLYIYPGYHFKRVNSLFTNFHLPKSTLFILACAFAGEKLIKSAYQEAVEKRYRFYSYGDAMLIL